MSAAEEEWEPEPHVSVEAIITDRHGEQERVWVGTQPAWAWEIDRCAAWRKMMRDLLLSERTSDARGWRVAFHAESDDD